MKTFEQYLLESYRENAFEQNTQAIKASFKSQDVVKFSMHIQKANGESLDFAIQGNILFPITPLPDLAKKAYEAYALNAEWKNYQGNPMPQWEDLPEKIRQHWEAAIAGISEAL